MIEDEVEIGRCYFCGRKAPLSEALVAGHHLSLCKHCKTDEEGNA